MREIVMFMLHYCIIYELLILRYILRTVKQSEYEQTGQVQFSDWQYSQKCVKRYFDYFLVIILIWGINYITYTKL